MTPTLPRDGVSGLAGAVQFVGGDPERDKLLALGHTLNSVLPTGDPHAPKIDANRGGYPFVTVSFDHAYEPGRQPLVRLDTRAAATALDKEGINNLNIDISAPYVGTSAAWNVKPTSTDRGSWSWSDVSASSSPAGTVQLRPDSWHGWIQFCLLAIVVTVLIGGLVLWRAGRSRASIACGAFAILGGVASIATAGLAQMDNLGVSGAIGEPVLRYVRWLPLACILGACGGIVLIVVTAANPRKKAPAA